MPKYLVKPSINSVTCCPPTSQSVDRNGINFLYLLADKLVQMSTTLEKRIKDIQEKACNRAQDGILLVSIDAPQMVVGVKYEYIEYIKRYGPPCDGKFDEKILVELRRELGIPETTVIL